MNKVSIEEQLNKEDLIQTTIGYSMYPMLVNRKTLVRIKKTNKKLKVYDLPLYKRKNQYVIHRIIDVKEDYYLIRGDNTYTMERIPFNNVIGIVEAFYRKGKWYSVENRWYKCYVVSWNKIYYLRKVVVMLKRKIGSWKRKQQ